MSVPQIGKHQVKPEKWAHYKIKCAQFAPQLVRLADFFKEIAAGKYDHDPNSTHIVDGVDSELEAIRDELNDSLKDVSRYANAESDVI